MTKIYCLTKNYTIKPELKTTSTKGPSCHMQANYDDEILYVTFGGIDKQNRL